MLEIFNDRFTATLLESAQMIRI